MLRKFCAFTLLALGALHLHGQDLRAPATHNFNAYDYITYSGIVAYRVGDYFTTEHALAHGAVEGELPDALVRSKPGFATYSLGMAALEIEGSVYLHRHGHKRLARIADTISVGAGVRTVYKNSEVP